MKNSPATFPFLEKEEEILWTAKPNSELAAKMEAVKGKMVIGCCSIVAVAFAIGVVLGYFFWESIRIKNGLIGFGVSIGFVVLIRILKPIFTKNAKEHAERTHYILTDRRAIVYYEDKDKNVPITEKSCWIVPAEKMSFLKVHKHKVKSFQCKSLYFIEVWERGVKRIKLKEKGFEFVPYEAADEAIKIFERHFKLQPKPKKK